LDGKEQEVGEILEMPNLSIYKFQKINLSQKNVNGAENDGNKNKGVWQKIMYI
jgi:hypothetical protein